VGTQRIDLAYNGAGFAGWAAQPGMRTVQAELERALEQILGAPAPLTVAGRTDAGVHAWAQVASFGVEGDPPETIVRGLNGLTGDDLAVIGVKTAPGFDARRDARSRTYCYRVLSAPAPSPFELGVSLYWPHRLEAEALEACAEAVRGTHDFTAFTPTDTDHVRFERDVLACEWRAGEPHPVRALDRGGRLHAQHGQGAGGDDARGGRRAPLPGGLPGAAGGGTARARRTDRLPPGPSPGLSQLSTLSGGGRVRVT
jgi:tRNA pseudouridine38-40 synthase